MDGRAYIKILSNFILKNPTYVFLLDLLSWIIVCHSKGK